MARRHKSQEERDRYDERRLNWLFRVESRALSFQELTALTGMPADRILAAICRLTDDGMIGCVGANKWQVLRGLEIANAYRRAASR